MTTNKAADATPPPALKKDWRFYAGLGALALSVALPLSAALVPLLGLSTTSAAMLVGVLVAGGPEVMCILAVALLGKDTFNYFMQRAKSMFRQVVIDRPASRTRYYVGLAIMLVSWLPAYLYAYFPVSLPGGYTRIYILAGMDLAFVVSVFVMGGEFWEKVRRIFVYDGRI
jgi:hypothetical protein